jgi:hypothetical protein
MHHTQPAELTATPDEAFVLPVHGLFADLDAGIGCVCLPTEFAHAPCAIQLKVIADWQAALESQRRRAIVGLFRELSATWGDAPLPLRLEHLRETCKSLGIDCPPDMGLLLQQH